MKNIKASQTPEFVRLLNDFDRELNKLDGYSNIILNKLTVLGSFREPKNIIQEDMPIKSGIVGQLEERLRMLELYNALLEEAMRGLYKFVGE